MSVCAIADPRVTREQVEAAWAVYQPLAAAIAEDPKLAADWSHVTQMIRAHKAFADLYLAWDCC
jgi:hypothetical protein